MLRLNRLFWADDETGIARFVAQVDRYAAAGLQAWTGSAPAGAGSSSAAGGRVRRTRLRRDCRFRLVVRAPRRRRALVRVQFSGNVLLAPAARARRL